VWATPSGKASFHAQAVPLDTAVHEARALPGEAVVLTLATVRAHDQYNTTVYGLDDRYRGVYGQRRVLFIGEGDLRQLGLKAGEWVDLHSVYADGVERVAKRFLLVEYDIPRGCVASYYPETNALVALESVALGAGTPSSKSIPVVLKRCDG
jgi:anaerobic selenocysteine-containing dehydrogenase